MSYHSRQPSVASSLLSSSTFNSSQLNKIGPWKLGKTLGRGSTGRVLLAENINTQQKAAVKVVSKSVLNNFDIGDEKGRDAAGLAYGIEREIIIMKLLNHPNVLRLYDVWETSKSLYLILEYVEGGELFDLLVERGPLSEVEAIRYFRQIVLGASYCHALGICHRDLKPENLLLDHDHNIKIADFGMAALENNDRLLETSCGSPHYAAPEIVSGKHYHGFESDVWSCGVILFALLTGRLPFDDENIRNLLLKVQQGSFEMPDDISLEAQDLIDKMLTVEASERIKTHEILNHPLLMKYPLSEIDSKTLQEQPSPNTYLSHIQSIDEIDEQILDNLVILWHGKSKEAIIKNLLRKESTTEKIFYFLLLRYRHNQSNSSLVRSLSIAKSVNHSSSGSINKTPRKNRRSIISVNSAHKKSVSFNNKNRRSIKDLNDLQSQPPVPKNLIDEFQKTQNSNTPINNGPTGLGVTKSTSKRRSMRNSLLPSKRSSMTSKLISVYAKLANDNDWEYIDKEAKRTSSSFATLCDEIFNHEKYEKLRQEKLEAERLQREEEERLEAERQRLAAEEEAKRLAAAQEEEEKERARLEAEEAEGQLLNNKVRSISGPNPRTSQLIDKDEISKIQQRVITNPIQSRPKSKLDPGLIAISENSKFIYDENDSVVQAIRRSKFLGSKFDLNLKRQSVSQNKKQLHKHFENEKTTDVKKESINDVDNYQGPKTIAEVKIPQVTRKSRHFSTSNKRLSVLSIYSTRDSYTNLAAKLKEFDEQEASGNNKRLSTSSAVKKSSPVIQQAPQSHSKSSGLRLSYADRLTALQETQEESPGPVVEEEEEEEGKENSDEQHQQLHADDSMYKGLNIPDLPDHYQPVSKPQKFQIHKDQISKPQQQSDSPKPLPKPKRSAPSPPVNPSISTTKITKDPLTDVTNKNRSGSGGSFFRKWSLGKKDSQTTEQQQQSGGFFSKFGSSANATPIQGKSLNTVYEPNEMYQTLKRLLLGWNDYGLKNIKAHDDDLIIEGEISKNNIMSLSGTKFKLQVEEYGKKGSVVKSTKPGKKGSTKSFKTLINEIERILNRENVLAFSN